MTGNRVDALVIFGATGDLAKLETFPALVGLVERGVLDVPVVGVAKSGWGLEQFRDYAAASLKLNNMDPTSPAADQDAEPAALRRRRPRRRRHLPGDVADGRPGQASCCSTWRCRRSCSGGSPRASPPRAGPRAPG